MFTDKFFRFPIKVWDGFDVKKTERVEELTSEYVEAIYYIGQAQIPIEEIIGGNIYWYDSFTIGRNVDEEGFDSTSIFSKNFGSFTCAWERKKFEHELNNFMCKNE